MSKISDVSKEPDNLRNYKNKSRQNSDEKFVWKICHLKLIEILCKKLYCIFYACVAQIYAFMIHNYPRDHKYF